MQELLIGSSFKRAISFDHRLNFENIATSCRNWYVNNNNIIIYFSILTLHFFNVGINITNVLYETRDFKHFQGHLQRWKQIMLLNLILFYSFDVELKNKKKRRAKHEYKLKSLER